jgi:hypothetical protein
MRRTEVIFWAILVLLAVAANLLRAYLKLDIPTVYVIATFAIIGLLLWWALLRRKATEGSHSQT